MSVKLVISDKKNTDAGRFVNRVITCTKKYGLKEKRALDQLVIYPYDFCSGIRNADGCPLLERPAGSVPVTAIWTNGKIALLGGFDFEELLAVVMEALGLDKLLTPGEFLGRCYHGVNNEYAIPMSDEVALGTSTLDYFRVFTCQLDKVNRETPEELMDAPCFSYTIEQFFHETKKAWGFGGRELDLLYSQEHYNYITKKDPTYKQLTPWGGVLVMPYWMPDNKKEV